MRALGALGAAFIMIVAGVVNPPPIADEAYAGIYLSQRDDVPRMARSLAGAPLRVEHSDGALVGRVLNGWTDAGTGALWALAELDVSHMAGALAAAAIERGTFREFSLGYTSRVGPNPATGRIEARDKRVVELSIVKTGARPGCTIAAATRSPIQKKKNKEEA